MNKMPSISRIPILNNEKYGDFGTLVNETSSTSSSPFRDNISGFDFNGNKTRFGEILR